MQRMALALEYGGANYFGWQKQNNKPTIQAQLERSLAKVADHEVATFCAGRTDAGVHASYQVVHFDTTSIRKDIAWIQGVNSYLPKDIRVLWAAPVCEDFDARKSATSRRYCYILSNRPISPGILHGSITWTHGYLDLEPMQMGAQYLLGEHDFTSFRAAECQAKSPVRTIHHIKIVRKAQNFILDISANAFLYHMVRNIMGSLIAVGHHQYPPSWIKEVLLAKDRTTAGMTASPAGLYLSNVSYPPKYQLPLQEYLPWFFD